MTVQQKKAYTGEVTFIRDEDRLTVYRGADKNDFSVTYNNDTYEGDEASKRLAELLMLETDTFSRTVLLQQTKIRGLLMDSIKERNKALDRLLGMDTIGTLLEILKSKSFTDAAEAWNKQIEAIKDHYSHKESLLMEQRESCEDEARELGFSSRDFYQEGLQNAYLALSSKIVNLGSKYDVTIDELPECTSLLEVKNIKTAVSRGIEKLRQDVAISKKTLKIEKSLTLLSDHEGSWNKALDNRQRAENDLKSFIDTNDDLAAIEEKQKKLKGTLIQIDADLKSAGALRKLLVEARDFMETNPADTCPVCEQILLGNLNLPSTLQKRIHELVSKSIQQKEIEKENIISDLDKINRDHEAITQLIQEFEDAQTAVKEKHEKIIKMFGGAGIAENRIKEIFEKEIAKRTQQKGKLYDGINILNQEIKDIEDQLAAIIEGLLPVLRKREEQIKLEKEWKQSETSQSDNTANAEKMESIASQILSIRDALMEAKDKLASDWLIKARPRSLELYKSLVNHPLFDTLNITTKRLKQKVDYDFKVGIDGDSKNNRDAHLVLSNGQLTATAMALLFSLAESTTHSLDLLYIDDPTQNLDGIHKQAMAKVITDLASRKQVIVSTQDEDFVASLKSYGFNDSAIVHHIKKWDGTPTVDTAFPYD